MIALSQLSKKLNNGLKKPVKKTLTFFKNYKNLRFDEEKKNMILKIKYTLYKVAIYIHIHKIFHEARLITGTPRRVKDKNANSNILNCFLIF